MIPRKQIRFLLESLDEFPVTAIVGPRQVGKTTLAHQLATVLRDRDPLFLDLERPSDITRLEEAEMYLDRHADRLVIIDEVQRRPSLFPLLRALVDAQRRPGRFLLLGSSSIELSRSGSESLAGRIQYFELSSLLLSEIDETDHERLWLRGGFPLSYLAATDAASLRWRQALITTYLDRDIPSMGVRVPAATLRRFCTMLAHQHGGLWQATSLANALGISSPSVSRYLDLLCDLFVVRRLTPFAANGKKRLVKAPKMYLRDSGLLHALLGIGDMEQLLGHPIAGLSFEGFAIEQIIAAIPLGFDICFYRTSAGAELDLLVVPPSGPPMAFEIKNSLSPRVTTGFRTALSDLGIEKAWVIYPGDETWPLDEKTTVLPLRRIEDIRWK